MNIETTIWKITDGEITELKHGDNIFVIKKEPDQTTNITIKRGHGIKKCYLEKWIKQIDYEVFTLEQFYKEYPLQRSNKNLDRNISRLIADNKLIQLGKNKFKVVKDD